MTNSDLDQNARSENKKEVIFSRKKNKINKINKIKENMNSRPLSFPNEQQLAKNRAIKTKIPGPYEGTSYHGLNADALLGFDK